MSSGRFVVLGLASVRAAWPREVTGWAMAGAIPIEFVKCVSVEEVKARLRSGRRHSAVLLDASAIGVDRDLLAMATEFDTASIVVGSDDRDWAELGASARLHEVFSRQDLHDQLVTHSQQYGAAVETPEALTETERPAGFRGRLVSVIGRAGSGTSTMAAGAAQGCGSRPATRGQVLLADLALDGNQAMLHDAIDIVPGIQELCDAHRTGRTSGTQLRSMMYDVQQRGYDLLLGLRRQRDWVALRPRALSASIDNLLANYRIVIADLTDDLEGEDQTGSIDVEERNAAARLATLASDVVLVVGTPGLTGVHATVRTIDALVHHGVEVDRIATVINRAPRSAGDRSDIAAALKDLVDADDRDCLAPPLFIPERKRIDDAHRNGTALPPQITKPLVEAIEANLARLEPKTAGAGLRGVEPQPVAAGSLGAAIGGGVDGAAS